MEEKIKWKCLKYSKNKCTYGFQKLETRKSLGDNIYTGKINIEEAEMDQSNLLENMAEFNDKFRSITKEGKEKINTYESVNAICKGRELTLNPLKGGMFPIRATKGEGLKILTLKQILQRLPIALAQVKVGKIIYSDKSCILCIKQNKFRKKI